MALLTVLNALLHLIGTAFEGVLQNLICDAKILIFHVLSLCDFLIPLVFSVVAFCSA
jgi:hypothetical protein